MSSVHQTSIHNINTVTSASPKDKSVPRSAFTASGMMDTLLHPMDAINKVVEQIQQGRQAELQALLNRFTANGQFNLDERIRDILSPKEIEALKINPNLTYRDMMAVRQIEKRFFGKDNLFEKRLQARQDLEQLWPKDENFAEEKVQLIQNDNFSKVDILKGIFGRTGAWGELKDMIDFFEKRKVKFTIEDNFMGKSVITGNNGEDKSYLDLLMAEGLITASDKALLERFRDRELAFNDKEIHRLKQVQTRILQPRYQELQEVYEKKGNWGRLANLIEAFRAPKLSYERNDYYLWHSFKVTTGGDKSYIDLLKDQGYLSANDVELLDRFVLNKNHLSDGDIHRLQHLSDEVLSPVGLLFKEESNQAEKVFLPSELERMKKIKEHKNFSSSDLRFLQDLLDKYFSEDNFTNRKIDALRIHRKLFPNTPLTEEIHQRLEDESEQEELMQKQELYDRNGEWKNVETVLTTLLSIRDDESNFLTFLNEQKVITPEELDMLLAFLNLNQCGNLDATQRAHIMKLYNERLTTLVEALTTPKAGPAYKKVISEHWLSKWELDHARRLNGLSLSSHAPTPTSSAPHTPTLQPFVMPPPPPLPPVIQQSSDESFVMPPPPPLNDVVLPPPMPQDAPPPPPPPPMPQDALPPPPPPVQPPKKVPIGAPAAQPGRADLLAGIQKGKKLVHVTMNDKSKPIVNYKPPVAKSGETNLMNALIVGLAKQRQGLKEDTEFE